MSPVPSAKGSISCRAEELSLICPQTTLHCAFWSCWRTDNLGDWVIQNISYLHHLFLMTQTSFLSFWCLTCDAVPEPSCHHSLHIVLDRSKDVDELCALLLVDATFSSEVVTLRERLHLNLQLELEGLQEKKEKKAVELLMAENSSCLDKRRLMMQNWAALKWQSPSLIHGFISFKKSLKKAIEEMKEEAIQVEEMLPKHRVNTLFLAITHKK